MSNSLKNAKQHFLKLPIAKTPSQNNDSQNRHHHIEQHFKQLRIAKRPKTADSLEKQVSAPQITSVDVSAPEHLRDGWDSGATEHNEMRMFSFDKPLAPVEAEKEEDDVTDSEPSRSDKNDKANARPMPSLDHRSKVLQGPMHNSYGTPLVG